MSRIEMMRSRVTRRRRPRTLAWSVAAEADSSDLLANTRIDGRLNERLLRRRDILTGDKDGDSVADRSDPTFASRGAMRQAWHDGVGLPIRHGALQIRVVLRVASVDIGRDGALLRIELVLGFRGPDHSQEVEYLGPV